MWTQPPVFGTCLLWQNEWTDQDATWYGGRPRLRRHCVRWGSGSPKKGHSTPTFWSMSIVAKRLDGTMPLGTEVELGPGHIVRWASNSPRNGQSSPLFSAHVYCGKTVAHLSYCWALVNSPVVRSLFVQCVLFVICQNVISVSDSIICILYSERYARKLQ